MKNKTYLEFVFKNYYVYGIAIILAFYNYGSIPMPNFSERLIFHLGVFLGYVSLFWIVMSVIFFVRKYLIKNKGSNQ